MSNYSPSRPLLAGRTQTASAGVPIPKFIRSKTTKAFLGTDGTWTMDLQKAQPFADILQACAAAIRFPSHDIEIYYSFDPNQPSRWDFAMSLP